MMSSKKVAAFLKKSGAKNFCALSPWRDNQHGPN
jgi:hypothetical protein